MKTNKQIKQAMKDCISETCPSYPYPTVSVGGLLGDIYSLKSLIRSNLYKEIKTNPIGICDAQKVVEKSIKDSGVVQ